VVLQFVPLVCIALSEKNIVSFDETHKATGFIEMSRELNPVWR
jgi:hypothetical protein